MGTCFTASPAAHPLGFVDAASHREELSRVYNHYLRVDGEGDETSLVMRPLFTTSVLLDLMLAGEGFRGAETVVLTSASSKTAYGLAHLLGKRRVKTIGLTSAARVAWVESLGLYDTVLAYDELREPLATGTAALVDLAGHRALLRRLHELLGGRLKWSILVGFTHHEAEADEAPLPAPAPEFFFAPDEVARRGRELAQQYATAWEHFAPVAERTMHIERISDGNQLVRLYHDLLRGNADPGAGYVVSLGDP